MKTLPPIPSPPGPGNWFWAGDKIGWERIKDGIVGTCITYIPPAKQERKST